MKIKFQEKYRIESHRKRNWDYSSNGIYFLTIVTQHRECILGKIEESKMILSDFGKIVKAEWEKSFEIRDELFLEEYIIMPNHLHAIVVLKKPKDNMAIVETHGSVSLQNNVQNQLSSNHPIRKPKSISSFVAGFKSIVVHQVNNYIDENQIDIPKYNRNNHFFQPNYHDHIINNKDVYVKIKNYIKNNPLTWKEDSLNA